MSVKEYRKKDRVIHNENRDKRGREHTIVRFLSRLRLEIRDRVELLPYRDLDDLVQLCITMEQQNLRKSLSKKEKTHSNKGYP